MKSEFSRVLSDVPTNKNHTVFSWKPDSFAGGHLYDYANYHATHGIIIESGNVLSATQEGNLYPNGSIDDVKRIDTTVVGKTLLAYVLANKYLLSNDHIRKVD